MKRQKALLGLFGVTTLMASLLLQAMPAHRAYANPITARSLTLQAGTGDSNSDGIPDGGSMAGAVVKHQFTFTPPTTANVGSIVFKYCTTAADVGAQTCVKPTGLQTTSATLGTLTGITGFTLVNTTDGTPYLTNATTPSIGGAAITVQLAGVTNPSGADCPSTTPTCTFFVRIATYASTDGTGSAIDNGTVAASTTNQVVLNGTMPESLVFCTGDAIGTTSGVPDCSKATNNIVAFDKLFSPVSTAVATSQMAASTNAGSGYAITVNGPTLKSGSNQIDPIDQAHATVYDASAADPWSEPSRYGISQFGLNLVVNAGNEYTNAPIVGTAIAPASGTGHYNGEADVTTGYGTPGNFKFDTGNVIADSTNTGSDAQIYTASYIVNVPGSQPAGLYATTLTYICTPTF